MTSGTWYRKPLTRDPQWMQQYHIWNGHRRKILLQKLRPAFLRALHQPLPLMNPTAGLSIVQDSPFPVRLFEHPTCSVLLILAGDPVETEDLEFLQEWIREQILQSGGYVPVVADKRYDSSIRQWVERYHLKPDYRKDWNQRWGTFTLELYRTQDGAPSFLKLTCARVQDRILTHALPFSSFVHQIFLEPFRP